MRGVGRVPALFAYEGTGAAVIRSLKFGDARLLIAPLADALVDIVAEEWARDDLTVSWSPTSGRRRRARGFDQSELLARAVARRLGVPARPLLRRAGGSPQTGRSRAERAHNVSFTARKMIGGPVLVLDDVCTTGATLRAVADALRPACTGPLGFAVVARTP